MESRERIDGHDTRDVIYLLFRSFSLKQPRGKEEGRSLVSPDEPRTIIIAAVITDLRAATIVPRQRDGRAAARRRRKKERRRENEGKTEGAHGAHERGVRAASRGGNLATFALRHVRLHAAPRGVALREKPFSRLPHARSQLASRHARV